MKHMRHVEHIASLPFRNILVEDTSSLKPVHGEQGKIVLRMRIAGDNKVRNLHVRHIRDSLYIPGSDGLIEGNGSIKHAFHRGTRTGIPSTEIDIKRIRPSQQDPFLVGKIAGFPKEYTTVCHTTDIPMSHASTCRLIMALQAVMNQCLEIGIVDMDCSIQVGFFVNRLCIGVFGSRSIRCHLLSTHGNGKRQDQYSACPQPCLGQPLLPFGSSISHLGPHGRLSAWEGVLLAVVNVVLTYLQRSLTPTLRKKV
jgi:hypothetical protein